MNFLAHMYLSGEDTELMVGNFIADDVKGNVAKKGLPPGVARGIVLHREIDRYTDAHPQFKKSRKRLSQVYNHYAGVIVDIFYDHFLALWWQNYASQDLNTFADNCYRTLATYEEHFSPKMKRVLHFMAQDNWLVSYASIEGITRVLAGMSRRTTFTSHMEQAPKELLVYHESFGQEFQTFFPDIVAHVETWRKMHP